MDINEFIRKRPYLYHLTNAENARRIIATRRLHSTNRLIDLSGNEGYQTIKRERRLDHKQLTIEGEIYWIRDQRPISELALSKCLTDGWNVADFLEHLNDRVFMWPTVERLIRHYDRYEVEGPAILRFNSQDVIGLNPHVKFCRLNSGATRANSYLGGIAPQRGPNTFLPAENYLFGVASVAEVTFEVECSLNCDIWLGTSPGGVFTLQ